MSKSLGNAIYLSDSPETVIKKVKSMYTDPYHLKVEDPGQVEGNPVFDYLDVFDPDQDRVQKMKDHYQRGGLGDSTVKKHLIDVLLSFLVPIQEKRLQFSKDKQEVFRYLKKGTEKAIEVTSKTLLEVRNVMHLDYF